MSEAASFPSARLSGKLLWVVCTSIAFGFASRIILKTLNEAHKNRLFGVILSYSYGLRFWLKKDLY